MNHSNMDNLQRWISHSPMSDPGRYLEKITALSSDVGSVICLIQGLLVHGDLAAEYGLDPAKLSPTVRKTLSMVERLQDVLQRDGRPFEAERPPERRSLGTCRDFALMLCSILRCHGVPSRIRCGFAAYFGAQWEDHWVCEYWDAKTGLWLLGDAQLDRMITSRNAIRFDPIDVPRSDFLTAGEAWLGCRSGQFDSGNFGHGDVTGLWSVKINVWRDHYALNAKETSEWDRWRKAPLTKRTVHAHETAWLDDLAAHPEQKLREVVPHWLT
jgi:hypothetical protein